MIKAANVIATDSSMLNVCTNVFTIELMANDVSPLKSVIILVYIVDELIIHLEIILNNSIHFCGWLLVQPSNIKKRGLDLTRPLLFQPQQQCKVELEYKYTSFFLNSNVFCDFLFTF